MTTKLSLDKYISSLFGSIDKTRLVCSAREQPQRLNSIAGLSVPDSDLRTTASCATCDTRRQGPAPVGAGFPTRLLSVF